MANYFKRLFGKSESQGTKAKPTASIDPSKDPNLIRVFDSYGREMFISREHWRKDVLPGSVEKAWNDPDQLYGIIFTALNDGFRSDVVSAAKQLYKIDPDRSRGTCVWAIVLKEEGRLDDSENVLRDYLKKYGEEGVIVTNLAKIYARRKDNAKAEELLWHALELDPNQDTGMGWYEVIHRERGGDAASQAALQRIAALPKSWRAQLWLARKALQSTQLDRALDYYRESLSRIGRPVPTDVLMQISGDLGNAAHLPELLALTEPLFDPTVHGIQVGNNLIKAHVDLGQLEAAKQIIERLYALKRPDWRETLSFWETEIAKTNIDSLPKIEGEQPKISMLAIKGPIWLNPKSPAAELFPAKSVDGPLIAFLGSTAELAADSNRMQHQLTDAPGRMSRAFPLFLAEQVEFNTSATSVTLTPCLASGSRAFVLSPIPWNDEDAADYARRDKSPCDYVVITHLNTKGVSWVAELRLVRTIDAKRVAQRRAEFVPTTVETALPDLAHQLLMALSPEVQRVSPPKLYQFPTDTQFRFYLLRLEQLLATRCSAMEGAPPDFLTGPREIIDGNIQLCLASKQSVPARLLLANTLLAMKHARPDVVDEFRDKLSLLRKEHPLQEPAQSVIQRIIDDAFKRQEPKK